jgi:hypothetical protein
MPDLSHIAFSDVGPFTHTLPLANAKRKRFIPDILGSLT